MADKKVADRFLGSFCVREFVFDGAGALMGEVNQERVLRSDKGGGMIVRQKCRPCGALMAGPMGRFKGEFVFSLRKEGYNRLYEGEDVVGFGREISPGFMVGEGVWPRFGWNFRSFSILVDKGLQLTGGTFYRGGEVCCEIIGVATPMEDKEKLPRSLLSFTVKDGEGEGFTLKRGQLTKSPLKRRSVVPEGFCDVSLQGEHHYLLTPRESGFAVSLNGSYVGMGRYYGPAAKWQVYGTGGESIWGMDLVCPLTGGQFGLRHKVKFGETVYFKSIKIA